MSEAKIAENHLKWRGRPLQGLASRGRLPSPGTWAFPSLPEGRRAGPEGAHPAHGSPSDRRSAKAGRLAPGDARLSRRWRGRDGRGPAPARPLRLMAAAAGTAAARGPGEPQAAAGARSPTPRTPGEAVPGRLPRPRSAPRSPGEGVAA